MNTSENFVENKSIITNLLTLLQEDEGNDYKRNENFPLCIFYILTNLGMLS